MRTRTGKLRRGHPCFAVRIARCTSFGHSHLCMLKEDHKGTHKCVGQGCGKEWPPRTGEGGRRSGARFPGNQPSPYLKRMWTRLLKPRLDPKTAKAMDLGCGNGRNTRFLKAKGLEATDVDAEHQDPRRRVVLGKDRLPTEDHTVDLMLLNYVTMFLGEQALEHLALEIGRTARKGCLLVTETYPARTSLCKDDRDCETRTTMLRRMLLTRQDWQVLHKAKNRQVWERTD